VARAAPEGSDRTYSVLETEGARLHSEQVVESWRRSLNDFHVDPASPDAPRILTSQELIDARGPAEELIAIAKEENDRLYEIVGKVGYVLLFTSPQGVVVDVRGDTNRADQFVYWGVWKGGVWAEDVEGTNGIGTCIVEQRPVTVHRTQHFRSRNRSLSCCGAPVFGPDGELVAVLDVSSIDPQVSEHSHGLALSVTMNSARVIEERLFRQTFRRAWILMIMPAPGAEPFMLAVDADQRIVGADRSARSLLGIDSPLLAAGSSLWTFFERAPSVFRPRNENATVELTRNGEDRPWRAMVTTPQQPRIGRLDRLAAPARTESALSPRERNILELIGQGRSNKEIARLLGISPETVKSHIKNMFAKLGVERRAEAVYRLRAIA
jgi:transcriptional regulator of acetoin/glycerol metabolism